MIVSEKLGLPVAGRWAIEGHPSGYWGLLKQWFDYFGLSGPGLIIGDRGAKGEAAKKALKREYPGITVKTVDLLDADIIWDITRPPFTQIHVTEDYCSTVDWVICQAMLEHVEDPVASMKNMAAVLNPRGRIFLHTVGPAFKYHRHPIDCYRYFRDALIVFGEITGLEILDIYWEPRHCFCAYEKPHGIGLDNS